MRQADQKLHQISERELGLAQQLSQLETQQELINKKMREVSEAKQQHAQTVQADVNGKSTLRHYLQSWK